MKRYHQTATLIIIGVVIGYMIRGQIPPFSNTPALLPSEKATPSIIISPSPSITSPQFPSDVHTVKDVTDGDTITLDNGQKVRYIGIDTPEIHKTGNKPTCYGAEAKTKNTELVAGKTILLKKDISEVDRYGRLLRFVYLYDPVASKEGTFVNDYLLRQGYAQQATFPPDVAKVEEFKLAEQEARTNKRGLWASCK